jgi:hypothetical protein
LTIVFRKPYPTPQPSQPYFTGKLQSDSWLGQVRERLTLLRSFI